MAPFIERSMRTRRRRGLKRLSPAHKGRGNASSPRLVRTAGNIVPTRVVCPSVPIVGYSRRSGIGGLPSKGI
eukprot:6103378-Heterocapsa_arctica.AAC.1